MRHNFMVISYKDDWQVLVRIEVSPGRYHTHPFYDTEFAVHGWECRYIGSVMVFNTQSAAEKFIDEYWTPLLMLDSLKY